MSTRKLILAAVACGLAILIAGTMWLVLQNNDKSIVNATVVDVSVAQMLGDATVAVKSVAVVEGQYHVVVSVSTGASSVAAAKGWGLVVTVKGPNTVPVANASGLSDLDFQPCATQAQPPNSSVTCVMAFGPVPDGGATGQVFVSYVHAGARSTWQVSLPK